MTSQNQVHDDPGREKYYTERYGLREIWFNRVNESRSFTWVYEQDGKIVTHIRDVFSWENDEIDNFQVLLEPDVFLRGLGEARLQRSVRMPSLSPTMDGQGHLNLSDHNISIDMPHVHGRRMQIGFDNLFLDSFSVIENSEPRMRSARDLLLGPAESAIVSLVKDNPEIIHSFTPREFEVLVGSFLTHYGFSRVQLSRFVKDGGYDIYAVYCEGDAEYVVVVEVKHYTSKKVSIDIVDRLNGVRDREAAEKGMVVTSSGFSSVATEECRAKSQSISLIDFDRLVDLIGECSTQWEKTPSDLWTLPRSSN